MDVGKRRQLFTGALRRAAQVNGMECYDDFCDVPAEDCDIDHIEPYAWAGETIQENGRPACEFHNHRRQKPQGP